MNDDLNIVSIDLIYNHRKNDKNYSHQNIKLEISMIEQELMCNFKNYTIEVNQDSYLQYSNIVVKFDSIEDATLFKLQRPM